MASVVSFNAAAALGLPTLVVALADALLPLLLFLLPPPPRAEPNLLILRERDDVDDERPVLFILGGSYQCCTESRK